MSSQFPHTGPLAGDAVPLHGGSPDRHGCNGCVDCCYLPSISVTDEEAARLRQLYQTLHHPAGELRLTPDGQFPGWQSMEGPCVFRRDGRAVESGGCRIYEDRPSSCRIFTCPFLLDLRRG